METGQIILRKKITPSLSHVVIETRIRKITCPWRLGAMFWTGGFPNSEKQFVPMFPLAFVSRPGMMGKVSLEIPLPHLDSSLSRALPVGCTNVGSMI